MISIRKKQVSLFLLTSIFLLSAGLFSVSGAITGNEAGACDRDRDQNQTRDGDCDRDCICDGPGDCECNCYGPSDGDGGSQFGRIGDTDPKLKMVQNQIRWQYQWQWID